MASKHNGSTVKIVMWSKYNGRNDVKRCHWLRLENKISTSEAMFGLDAAERYVFIELMCRASEKGSDTLTINVAYLAGRARAKESQVDSAIEKLLRNGTIVKSLCTDPDASAQIRTDPPDPTDLALTGQDITGQNKTRQDGQDTTPPIAEATFDFESAFKAYPRRIKINEGIRRARKLILTQEEFQQFTVAIQRYANYCEAHHTLEKYIMHPPTFVEKQGEKPFVQPWREWVDYHPKAPPGDFASTPAGRRSQGNQAALDSYLSALGGTDEQAG